MYKRSLFGKLSPSHLSQQHEDAHSGGEVGMEFVRYNIYVLLSPNFSCTRS